MKSYYSVGDFSLVEEFLRQKCQSVGSQKREKEKERSCGTEIVPVKVTEGTCHVVLGSCPRSL